MNNPKTSQQTDQSDLRHFDYYEQESEKTGINILTLIQLALWSEKMKNSEYRKRWENREF